MGEMLGTLLRTLVLDDSAYQDWRDRPNLFTRGIVLIAIVILVAGLIVFAVNLVNQVRAPDLNMLEQRIRQGFEMQARFNPGMQNMPPEVQQMMDQMIETIIPMVKDIASIEAPLPRGISGFFMATGAYLSRVFGALGSWMLYGALVLIAVNLLGGTAKLPDFLGMTALYSIPLLLSLLTPLPCVGALLALVGWIWALVVYVKSVSVASGMDGGRSVIAVFAPLVVIILLGILLLILWIVWLAIVL
jgi:hypothetical protein